MNTSTPLQKRMHQMIEALRDQGFDQIDVAKAAGVSKGTVTQWLDGNIKSIKMENALGIEERFGYSHVWLVLGRGDPIADKQAGHIRTSKKDQAVFELLDVRAACGDGYSNEDHPEVVSTMFLPAQVAQEMLGTTNRNGNIKLITAAKDSMAPTINPDDLVFVDVAVNEYVGETVYLILHGNELLCKRLSLVGRDIVVSSDNKSYPDWKWSERPDATKIIGRVVRVLPIQFKKFGVDR
ncbi:S24 family peptidase [Alcaligenes sp. Me129]|uniref:S24 family peptidase n=1 Tax=Alcaligenes sp. Me129 TaxID=3392635 RepID=UPI003D1C15B5